MLKNIRSSLILGLVIINLIGFILFCITISNFYGEPKSKIKAQYSKDYYRLNEKNTSIYDNNKNNQTFNSNINKNSPQKFESTKNLNLRKLYKYKYFNSFYKESLLILNLIYLYFCLSLISSFFVGDNESRNCCCHKCDCSNCSCSNSNGGNGGELLVVLFLIFILIIIYFSTKLCGKHLSRYISLSFIIIINFSILIISFIHLSFYDDSEIKFNIIISFILLICNVLGISLPNFKKCENLAYKNNSPIVSKNINFPPYQLHEINNNGIAMNNNNFGYYNNSQVTVNPNIPNYPIPVVDNEYFANQQQTPNNISITNSTNNNSIDSSDNLNSQKLEYSGDMDIPPLPNQNLPAENKVNSNSKI